MSKATIFAVLAGLGWGIGELFTKSVLNSGKIGPMTALAVRATATVPMVWLVWFLFGRGVEPREWTAAPMSVYVKLIFGSGLIASAGATIAFFIALRYGEVSRIKPIAFSLVPATAVLLGSLVFHEPLTLRKIGALACILFGVALLASK